MSNLTDLWQGRRVTVLGMGASGAAAAQYLVREGAFVTVADTREAPPRLETLQRDLPRAVFVTGRFSPELVEEADVLVLSPGLSPEHGPAAPVVARARARGIDVIGEIELFAHLLNAWRISHGYCPKVIGVTGTNGKTTTTVLTRGMLEASGFHAVAAGNIGPNALTELVRAIDAESLPDAWVLELSSFQLETTVSLELDAAALLNVTEDHIDWHGSLAQYRAAKERIFCRTRVRVLSRAEVSTPRLLRDGDRTFGDDRPTRVDDVGLIGRELVRKTSDGWVTLLSEEELQLQGRHNTMNVLAALSLTLAAGGCEEKALRWVKGYHGEAHRVELVFTAQGVDVVDDSKGTNVGAVAAAVAGLGASGKPLFLLMGGDGKGQDFSPLCEPIRSHAACVALIGQDREKLRTALAPSGVELLVCDTLEEAVDLLWMRAVRTGGVLLLSPACASWDMFRDYAERSARFIAAARRVAGEA